MSKLSYNKADVLRGISLFVIVIALVAAIIILCCGFELAGYAISAGILLLGISVFLLCRQGAELAESRQFLQRVIDSTSDPLLVIDPDYRVILANRAAQRISGRSVTAPGCLSCHEFSHGRDKPCGGLENPCPLKTVVSGKIATTVTHTHVKNAGQETVVEISASPVLNRSGEIEYIIELSRDITARVRAEEQVRRHQAELAHVSRLGTMGEMATGLAHELNQPLAAIVNYLQAARERIRSGSADFQELLRDIEDASQQARRAGGIIEQIRNFVRKDVRERSKVNINTIIQQAVSLVKTELRNNRIEVNLELSDALPQVSAQEIQIEQVLVNLIRNSLDAMINIEADARVLTISTSKTEAGLISCTVCDTGCGLNEKELDQVFNPFFTTKAGGMGMGLPICRTIIEEHGGKLTADSDTDRGASFTFVLPVNEGEK